MDRKYLVFVIPGLDHEGIIGALPVPPCFAPTDAFVAQVGFATGLRVGILSTNDIPPDYVVEEGARIMHATQAAMN